MSAEASTSHGNPAGEASPSSASGEGDATTRPLRIVQIGTVDVGGCAEKVTRKLHEKFRERGHESVLVVGAKRSDDPDIRVIDNSRAGRGVKGRALRLLESRGGFQYLHYPGSHEIARLIGGEWDVTHIHNLHGGYFDLGRARGARTTCADDLDDARTRVRASSTVGASIGIASSASRNAR